MKFKVLVSALILFFSVNARAQSSVYKKAGEIQIKDHKATMAGTIRNGGDLFKIDLMDVGKVDGHICGCNTAGFLMTKKVLGLLFPNQIPVRNTVRVFVSEYNRDLMDAIGYITGIRLNTGMYTHSENEMSVDKSLAGKPGTSILVFERKDNGKKVKVILDKSHLLSKYEMQTIATIKPKIMAHKATAAEKKQYAEVTRAIVKKEITHMPSGAITYQLLD
ncbi:MAG TPA: hypothetical protein ENJ69_02205 [Bacteroidetes bacterium]|nr:hypothetical protein [Bacteroidota bacterium]